MKVKGVTFMEQNKTKKSNYAAMARAGFPYCSYVTLREASYLDYYRTKMGTHY